jgi:uncharacterized protein involved in type VI secretion and phage assembly
MRRLQTRVQETDASAALLCVTRKPAQTLGVTKPPGPSQEVASHARSSAPPPSAPLLLSVQGSGIGHARKEPDLGGVQRAIVLEAEGHGRIRLRVPAVSGADELWTLSIGGNHAFVPDRGDEVIVAFEEGDPRRPIVLGRLWGTSVPPAEA